MATLPAFRKLREEFQQCCEAVSDGVTSESTKSSGSSYDISCTPKQLASHWYKQVADAKKEEGSCPPCSLDAHALAIYVTSLMLDVDLGRTGRITVNEWIHGHIVRLAGRARQLNPRLKGRVAKYPTLLRKIQSLFEELECNKQDWKKVLAIFERRWPTVVSISRNSAGAEAGFLVRDLMAVLQVEKDVQTSYCDFLACCLGRERREVTLHLYDLSKGMAKQWGRWLTGEEIEGVWHTGVCVFESEYYFAGETMFQAIGKTSFGKPTKVVSLGWTLSTGAELHSFICQEMKPLFHSGTYDIITNNCNHFSDFITMFLLGKHVPDEVLRQPEYLMRSHLVANLVRPLLNRHFGDRVVAREDVIRLNVGPTRLSESLSLPTLGERVVWHFKNSAKTFQVGVICKDTNKNGDDDCVNVRFFEVPEGSKAPRICSEDVPCSQLSLASLELIDEEIFDALVVAIFNPALELGSDQLGCFYDFIHETTFFQDLITHRSDADDSTEEQPVVV